MSILDTGKMCTFSKISGVIYNDGTPLSNAKVIREVDYENIKTDETITDENGYFELPAAYVRTIAKFLPQQFVVGQTLTVVVNDTPHQIWRGFKTKADENSEAKGKPLVVQCELTAEKSAIRINGDTFITKCTWDVEPDAGLFD
ncbi:DUF6795 domain-containing protein [Parendozoicomonas sp. Alg238-R29]|uniref:DUF6795 domain-containing protein n=1 Tax=Parendozoicomonas sp. Alg238-R29 TaxID=2993446 RepID=UPI00248E799B|nr:DUF6795 domain-containing protein [Parendozoicomonas sp. Alg238-R29]